VTISWQTVLAVGIGGFFGAIARLYVSTIVNKSMPHEFPYGILTVNIVGSFAIGVLFALFMKHTISVAAKSFLITGFLGAFTTYSTFALESYFLLNTSLLLGIMNMMLNLFGTIIAAGGGYKLFFYLSRIMQ